MGLHEECGVLGIYDFDGSHVAGMLQTGLYALQHRGQVSCGIVTNDDGRLHQVKDNGLVSEVFTEKNTATLTGNIGVGHVRYSRADDLPENAQPLVSRYCKGSLTLAHNGSILNVKELREELENGGAIFQSTNDTEVIMHLIAIARTRVRSVEQAMLTVMKRIEGAYSMVLMSPRKLLGVRDPQGFRPLAIGKKGNSYILASESCVFKSLHAEFVRDVRPGEVVLIDRDGKLQSFTDFCGKTPSLCAFEYFYFARPDSMVDGQSVYQTRIHAGRLLAQQHPAEADVVVGVPESGPHFALGYSYESGIPYVEALIRNRYAGRVFSEESESRKEATLNIKLSVIESAVRDKRVVVVDDSVVSGTTAAAIVKMIRAAGAREVHLRIACPPFLFPCYFGTEIPPKKDLLGVKYTPAQIGKRLGADSIGFLPVEKLAELGLTKDKNCTACFTGEYPVQMN
ncbi:MAG: amidophosphoribosyltransferase [Clostridia bacterium]|nr:amidophosphoribosyltransferase [Clostridia bacterium]